MNQDFSKLSHPQPANEEQAPNQPAPNKAAPEERRDGSGASAESSTGAAVAERPATTAKAVLPKVDKLPPYRVLLHNDDHNEISYVVDAILSLTSVGETRAVQITKEAHEKGLAEVIVTHQERAELYCEQFRSKRLSATAEPVV